MMGKDWYPEINLRIRYIARKYNVLPEVAIGIFVSLSAQKKVHLNFVQFEQFISGKTVDGLVSKTQLKQCERILSGEDPLNVWGEYSLKYREFYKSILLRENACCIDSHMIKLYKIKHPRSMIQKIELAKIFKSKRYYGVIQTWVRRLAKKNGVKSWEMQSILWVEQRGKHF